MKNQRSLIVFKSAEEKMGPVTLTTLQISGQPGIRPGKMGMCMTGKRKKAGQGDLQEPNQVRRWSSRENEYRLFVQQAKSDSLARTNANP